MSTRTPVDPASLDGGDAAPSDRVFQLAVAVYGGVLLAGTAATIAALIDDWPVGLVETYTGGFLAGFVGGAVISQVDPLLPVRLGRTLVRRLALVLPSVVFVGLWLVPLESPAGRVALLSAVLVVATGHVLSQLAGNRYVDAVTPGDPDETWRWEPSGSVALDLFLAGMWVLLALANAVTGTWLEALFWLVIGSGWVASCLAEGRWPFGPGRDRCELQCYESGLVKRQPYTKTFVPWADVDHVRLRGDELVLDRGLGDVRFERDELEDPEAVLEAVDERVLAIGGR
ncbi:hypothetical protein RBH26_15340 [Natronolimnohabitans sp. A-GB9]|uniref:hypothetical protein n=1 Tax=Natronolimnohabitans sp. A-GB9 TaxID=3069757 RepID=UPI0027B2B42E|nr:hypothetical protein [Natronolimnohabitans sp. A-GB9]MDQ2051852.1 hypothetical protein [Natronolimnohabitans sp. A-GB9]